MINKILLGDISVFDQEITKDILDKIRWVLNLYYKHINGVVLNQYYKSFITSIKETSMDKISFTIDALNKLTYFPYINQELIDFTLVDIIRKNKGNEVQTNVQSEVIRRERKRIN